MQNRVDAVEGFSTKKAGYDALPEEALAALKKAPAEETVPEDTVPEETVAETTAETTAQE